jgi:hypothetical protein
MIDIHYPHVFVQLGIRGDNSKLDQVRWTTLFPVDSGGVPAHCFSMRVRVVLVKEDRERQTGFPPFMYRIGNAGTCPVSGRIWFHMAARRDTEGLLWERC